MSDFKAENEELREMRLKAHRLDPGQWLGSMFSPNFEDEEYKEEEDLEKWRDAIEEISGLISSTLERVLVVGGLYSYTPLKWHSEEPTGQPPILLTYVGREETPNDGCVPGAWQHTLRFVSQDGKPWTLAWAESMWDSAGEEPDETLFSENNQCFMGLERIERLA